MNSVATLPTRRKPHWYAHPLFTRCSQKRIWSLVALFLINLASYIALIKVAPVLDGPIRPFLFAWGGCFLLYFLTCCWVLRTSSLLGGSWLELCLILLGAVVFRVMLLPLPLGLSRDAWRYLWDGRIMMHGFNPYLYTPLDKALVPLRDSVFQQTPWRQIPSIYPPLAELFFLAGYLLMPTQLFATKALFVLCDLVTCFSLAVLLARKRMDPRRVLIYAWCPLPIVEFAIEGHADAVVIAFTLLAVLFAQSSWRGARVCTGVFLGLATLAKLYPLLLLFALLRRRDWALLAPCLLTILIGFLPFLLTAQGHFLSPFQAFLGQQTLIVSVLLDTTRLIGYRLGLSPSATLHISLAFEYTIAGVTVLAVAIQRWRDRISIEAATLVLIMLALSLYSHLFPWYAPALLPWVAQLFQLPWTKGGFKPKGLAVAACWYLTVAVIVSYLTVLPGIYYGLSFGIVLLGLGLAGITSLIRHHLQGKDLERSAGPLHAEKKVEGVPTIPPQDSMASMSRRGW